MSRVIDSCLKHGISIDETEETEVHQHAMKQKTQAPIKDLESNDYTSLVPPLRYSFNNGGYDWHHDWLVHFEVADLCRKLGQHHSNSSPPY